MIQEFDTDKLVQPRDIFGSHSAVCSCVTDGFSSSVMISSFMEFIVILLTLFYVYLIIRYYDILFAGIFRSIGTSRDFGRNAIRSHTHLSYVKFAMTIVGVITACVVLIAHRAIVFPLMTDCHEVWFFLKLLLWIIVFIVAHLLLMYLSFNFSTQPQLLDPILEAKLFHTSRCSCILVLLMLFMIKSSGLYLTLEVYAAAGVLFLICIVYVHDTLRIFRNHGISILYWFLYLCVLEIFPISLLFYPVMR